MTTTTPPHPTEPAGAVAAVRRLLLLMVAGTLALIGAFADPPPAQAAEGLVTIHLDSVTPDALAADGTVKITGRVTNTSNTPMTQVQVSFWRSTDPVQTPADLDLLLGSAWDVPIGARMGGRGNDPANNLYNLTSDAVPRFQPGQTAAFTVSAQVNQLALTNPGPGSVYLVGVHVRAIPQGDVNQTVGRSRLFLPWQPTTARSQVAPVVLLTSAPTMTVDGSLADDHLAGELNGRLATLMRAAQLPGATVLVDPGMIAELRTMADGYVVDGKEVPADDARARAAEAWLRDFEALKGSIYRIPYGNPDVAAAAADNREEVVDRALAALPADHELADLPLAIWPSSQALPGSARDFLAPLEPALWVEPAASQGRFTLPDAAIQLSYDPSITSGGPGPDPRDSLSQRQGRLLSELSLTPGPTVLAVRTAAEAATVLSLPEWVTTVGLDDLPENADGPLPVTVTPPSPGPALWTAISTAHHRLEAWYDLGGAAANARVPAAQLASRAANPALVSRSQDWLDRALVNIPAGLGNAGVSLQMASTFVLGDSSGTLPITITNSSNRPVRVKVRMTSDNAQRITIPDTDLVTVPAQSSVSVQFRPEARTNGVVEFTAQAMTEGDRSVGQSHRFSVNATDFGRVGWIIIIASGMVVLGGTAIRIKQVQRERARHPQPAPTIPDDTTSTPRHDTSSRPHP